jgi:hypothetical protein
MLRPILDELELVGKTIPCTELAQICRNRKGRLPLRSFNGLQMAQQIDFLGHGGGFRIADINVRAHLFRNPENNRRTASIEFEREEVDYGFRSPIQTEQLHASAQPCDLATI